MFRSEIIRYYLMSSIIAVIDTGLLGYESTYIQGQQKQTFLHDYFSYYVIIQNTDSQLHQYDNRVNISSH